MPNEAINALLHKYVVEPWDKGNLATLDEVCVADYVIHWPGTGKGNLESVKQVIADWRRAFPDTHVSLDDVLAEGDRVAFRWTFHATHQGEYEGIAPTGKPMTITGMTLIRLVDGKVIEDWFESSTQVRDQLV